MSDMWKSLSIFILVMLLVPTCAFAANMFSDYMYGITFLSILLGIFLLCREAVCWYFKINETLGVLKETRDLLKNISIAKSPALASQNPTRIARNPEIKKTNIVPTREQSEKPVKQDDICPMCSAKIDKILTRCLACGHEL